MVLTCAAWSSIRRRPNGFSTEELAEALRLAGVVVDPPAVFRLVNDPPAKGARGVSIQSQTGKQIVLWRGLRTDLAGQLDMFEESESHE